MIQEFPRAFKYPFSSINMGQWRAKRPFQFSGESYEVMGYDTETAEGKAYLITNSKGRVCYPHSFQECVDFLTRDDEGNYRFFWNLRYDAQAIFKWLDEETLRELEEEGMVKVGSYSFIFTPKFLIISKGKERWVYTDLFLIYQMSLNNAGLDYLGRGKIDFDVIGMTSDDIVKGNGELRRYCLHDSHLTADLGKAFLKTAGEEGPLPARVYSQGSISEALLFSEGGGEFITGQMSRIPKPMVEAAYNSYCGGWNQVFSRGYQEQAFVYDINSAYPAEMLRLPDLRGARIFYQRTSPSPDAIGWLEVEVNVSEKDLPRLRVIDHRDTFYPVGKFRIWATTKELEGLDYKIIRGWWMVPQNNNDLFKDLVLKLYKRKKEYKGKDKFRYLYYKIALNSLYGKTVQVIMDQRTKRPLAGRLFCPFYGSLITAGARMNVYHQGVDQYPKHLLNISTDSLWSDRKLDDIPISDKIGDWSNEGQGKAVLLASGVYQVLGSVNKSRQRCFGADPTKTIDWFKILGESETETIKKKAGIFYNIKVPGRYNVTLYKALRTRAFSLADFNDIQERMKAFNLNPPSGRLWEGEFTSSQELLIKTLISQPVSSEMLVPVVVLPPPEGPLYEKNPSDQLYDAMRREKLYIQPGMSVYQEFIEGVPLGKRLQISTRFPYAKHLDEWSTDWNLSTSELIEMIFNATYVKDRKEKTLLEQENYREEIEKKDYEQDRVFSDVIDY